MKSKPAGKPKVSRKSAGGRGPASWLWWTLLGLLMASAVYLYWDFDGRDRLSRTVKPRTPPGERPAPPEALPFPTRDEGQPQAPGGLTLPPYDEPQLPVEEPQKAAPKVAAKVAKLDRESASEAKTTRTPKPREEVAKEPDKTPVRTSSLTRKQAAALVEAMFGGKANADGEFEGRLLFTLDGGKPSGPFGVTPGRVEIAARVHKGPFIKEGHRAFVVLVAAEDPEGPTWENRFVGAWVFPGSPRDPGKPGAAFALDAAQGWFRRAQALDVDGDGTVELLSEIEYSGQGGLLMREASVRHLGAEEQRALWTQKTLDDAPGQGAESATLAEFTLEEGHAGKGVLLNVTHKKVNYKVNAALERTRLGEEVLTIERIAF